MQAEETRIRALVAGFALSAVPVFLLLDTTVARLRGWRLPTDKAGDHIDTLGFWICVTVLAVVAGLLLWTRGRELLARLLPQVVVIVISTLLFWAAFEGLLAVFFPDLERYHRRAPNESDIRSPNPEWMPGISGDSRWTMNSLGVRGPEFPEDREVVRILCIGASTTANIYLDDEETWPYLLAGMLNDSSLGARFWVGDVGQTGRPTWKQVRFVDVSPLMDEIDVLVVLAGAADFFQAARGIRAWNNTRAAPLWSRTNTFKALAAYGTSIVRQQVRDRETLTGNSYVLRREERQAGEKVDELPDLATDLDSYRKNLTMIAEAARERGVHPIFATQPYVWNDQLSPEATDLLWLGILGEDRFLSVAALAEGMDLFNETMLDVCRDLDVQCIDMSPLNAREDLYFDDVHFTEKGAVEVARLVAEHVAENWATLATPPQ